MEKPDTAPPAKPSLAQLLVEDLAVEPSLAAFYEASRRGVAAGAAMRLAIQVAVSIAAAQLEAAP